MKRSSLVPLALLLAYALAFAATHIGTSLLVFDDHPGQLYRVWHVIREGAAPWRWDDGWWTGYPELQFYPPGFAWAAVALHLGSLGRLSVDAAYQALVWLAYLAPGVTAFLLLVRVTRNGWLALPGAFVVLTLSAGLASGVEGGVHIGMIAARLAWAMLPLLALRLATWVDARGPMPLSVIPIVAAIAITHPAHVPAAVLLVVLAAGLAPDDTSSRWRAALGVLGLAAALTAFWTLPLLLRLHETRALAWGTLTLGSVAHDVVAGPLLAALLLLAMAAPPLAASRGERLLAWWPWLVAAIVVVDAAVLAPAGVRWLPADRVADSLWLAIALAAGLTLARLIAFAALRIAAPPAIASVVLGVALALLSLPGQTLTIWGASTDWSSFEAVSRGMRLDALWAQLARAPGGRVLFTRSGLPIAFGTEWYRPHTHITALTPLRAGRAIVGGTFTHPSPVAALVYRGTAGPGAIEELAEKLDGASLFGRPLGSLDAVTFNRYADALGISTVVVLDEDTPRLSRALDRNPSFTRRTVIPPFILYMRATPIAIPIRIDASHWRFTATGAAGTWISTRTTYYPLWRASVGGIEIPTRRGRFDDLEVRLPSADPAVTLTYAPRMPELAGVAVSALAALAWLIVLARRR